MKPKDLNTDDEILNTFLWRSSQGFDYTIRHLLDDWHDENCLTHLPNREFPERGPAFVQSRLCAAIRDAAARPRTLAGPVPIPDEEQEPIPAHRLSKHDLVVTRDDHGRILAAETREMTFLDFLVADEVLDQNHAQKATRYASVREAYELIFYSRLRSPGDGGREDMKADDYLYLLKRLLPHERELIDFACFTPFRESFVSLIERRQRLYVMAFNRLSDLFDELDEKREREKEQESACATKPVVS